jgi:hypothetical protein
MTAGTLGQCHHQGFQIGHHQLDGLADVHAKVRRYLVVTTSARMKLQRDSANFFGKRGFDKRMDVLIGHRFDFVWRVLTQYGFKAAVYGFPFIVIQNSGTMKAFSVRSAGTDIHFEKNGIDRKRPIHFLEYRILFLLEPAFPEFHM